MTQRKRKTVAGRRSARATSRASTTRPLDGRIALVAGATRGAGRGIAVALGEAGATVYCSGRSVRGQASSLGRAETIDETAELVTEAGGHGIAVRADHTVRAEVEGLMAQVQRESGGLDLLVNDVWGGDAAGPFLWQTLAETDLDAGWALMRQAVYSHLLTTQLALPLLKGRTRPLIVEVTDGDTLAYRGALWYDLIKVTVMRLAFVMSVELSRDRITALAITPGFLRSEAMLEHFGVTEANWRDGTKVDPHFIASETPALVGRSVAALAADPKVRRWNGQTLSSWEVAKRYALSDRDGSRPDWLEHFQQRIPQRHPARGWMRDSTAWLDRILGRTNAFLEKP